jgi:uncharacterized membrane protein YfcA
VLSLGLSPLAGGFVALTVLGAAWVRGYSGFGFSALVITSAGLVTNPVGLIPVLMMCEVVMTAGQARGLRHAIDWRRTLGLLAGAAVAMPFSIALLARLGADAARLAISLTVLVICIAMLRGWRFAGPVGTLGNVIAGVASGIANGAAVGGLPAAVFLAGQEVDTRTFRATLIAYLSVLCLAALPLLWWQGVLVADSVLTLLWFLPLMFAGLWLGARRFHRSNPADFRRFTLVVLSILAVIGIARSLF